jgi:GH25 family lysozyme M1 (1,4-beta-N-acetylmuramidase)
MLYGVDVHPQYQKGLKIEDLPKQGYTFAAVKCTQGTSFYATGFAEWIGRIRKAGMIPGAYHWIEKGSGAAQCDWFLKNLEKVGGPNGLLIQLDCEDTATYADVKAWAARWESRTDAHPFAIYTGKWWWDAPGRKWDGGAVTPYLWDSRYMKQPDTNTVADNPASLAATIPSAWWAPNYGGWKTAAILQFTSKGDAGGIGNNVDLNATKMTKAQLLDMTEGDDVKPSDITAIADAVCKKLTADKAFQAAVGKSVLTCDRVPVPQPPINNADYLGPKPNTTYALENALREVWRDGREHANAIMEALGKPPVYPKPEA